MKSAHWIKKKSLFIYDFSTRVWAPPFTITILDLGPGMTKLFLLSSADAQQK
ncbi:hypothetical protein F444_15097 [Phytophthora nicotianae P1976]|uniref:Uncharacterized protein n=1 Tax=Phytophthora nicotianae P1976 TaxID=1317066 RepID=A0A080ZN34_PHYNI|nr:hypothetical protein F444_15097 [Phytophthora nicotianae P1976]